MKNYNAEDIRNLLQHIVDTVNEAHPDEEDEVGIMVWNDCLMLAETLGIAF